MKKIPYQFRFYSSDDPSVIIPSNANASLEEFEKGTLLNDYHFISQIGIQSTPGIKFSFNNNKNNQIEMGETGIYELDLSGLGDITAIQFDTSCEAWGKPGAKKYFYIFVDILYGEKEQRGV